MKKNIPVNKRATTERAKKMPSGATAVKRKRAMTRKRKAVIAVSAVLAIILLMFAGVFVYIRILAGRMNYVDPGKETIPEAYNPPTESLVNPVPSVKGVINVLLLGVDTRDMTSIGERSDAMMILTIDQSAGKIKLTSLQRDMLVHIPGVSEPGKINSANALGGPMLAVRVVNETFRLDIKKYMVVNMHGMEQIIDLAGGVWIDVKRAEIPHITPVVQKAGLQKLDGQQAVSYSRIRTIDSDYERMSRQRTVIQALLDAFMDADLKTKNNMISEGLSYITTNMSTDEILNIGINTIPRLDAHIEQLQIPIDGYFREYSGQAWVNLCDFNGMIPLLQEFIYGRTFPFDPVRIIPGAPNSGIVLATPTPRPASTTTFAAETTTAMTTTIGTTIIHTGTDETSAVETTESGITTNETTLAEPTTTIAATVDEPSAATTTEAKSTAATTTVASTTTAAATTTTAAATTTTAAATTTTAAATTTTTAATPTTETAAP